LLPIILDPACAIIGVAGAGEALERRRAALAEAGVTPRSVGLDAAAALAGLDILYVAGAPHEASRALALRARALGVLVNVEDAPDLCDFHVPGAIRRGNLLLTASTAGRAPAVARLIREWFETQFGPEWADRVDAATALRDSVRGEGLPAGAVTERTRALAAQNGWLR
jgi:precorrin-2 dehydrogenase/sirohydrochlorin ferrochelatase